jgi:hypothetical protein
MKNAILFLIISMSTSYCFSAVNGSKFDVYQQNIITEAVAAQCGIYTDLNQVSHFEFEDHVDNGVVDRYMTTEFQAKVRVDQNFFDNYLIKINSVLTAGYDHENKVWGLFSILNLTCHQN